MICKYCEREIVQGFGCECSQDDTRLITTIKEGSMWEHHSGREYCVVGFANVAHLNAEYPIMVIYKGKNGNVWAKTLANFTRTMQPKGEQ